MDTHKVRLNPIISEEVDEALVLEMSSCDDWTPTNIYAKLLRIVAIVSGRIFVGRELSRSEEYLDAAINYTMDVVAAQRAVNELTPWTRFYKAPYLPQVQKLDQRIREADNFLRPIAKARRDAANDPSAEKPDDMLQWLLDEQEKSGQHDDKQLAEFQLGISFAAIHTTTLTATNA
jgi:cytochrome P450